MALFQIDTEKQLFRTGYGHNYAWTNVYYVDRPDIAAAWDAAHAIADLEANVLTDGASIRFVQVRAGIGGAAPPDPELLGLEGRLSAGFESLNYFQTARLVAYAGSRLVWYKRWRGPLRNEDFSGAMLTDTYRTLLDESLLTPLVEGIGVQTRRGVAITSYQVDPLVRPWQMRDGSTRRLRSVLAGD